LHTKGNEVIFMLKKSWPMAVLVILLFIYYMYILPIIIKWHDRP